MSKWKDLFRQHLSDDDLVLLLGDELKASKKEAARQHLVLCARCYANHARLTRAARAVSTYGNHLAHRRPSPPDWRRDSLQFEMERLSESYLPRVRESQIKAVVSWLRLPQFNPTSATAMMLAVVAVGCVFLWLQPGRPGMTADTLLVRAEASDASAMNEPSAGVIRQTIRLKTPKQTLERAVYRDTQGHRAMRLEKLTYEENQLKQDLADAGVAWDAPLSAGSYQSWRSQQASRRDEIKRSARHLLVLATTAPRGRVAAQTITVRDKDFHPVDRTVAFRDSGNVEITELSYQVLPWDAVGSDIFSPLGVERIASAGSVPAPVFPRLAGPPTGAQLDEAELGARLVLNQLQADTGEQIRILRGARGIEVKGVVDTERRKAELRTHLAMLPNVWASIQSVEALKKNPETEAHIGNSVVTSVSVQASPLELYFLAHHRDPEMLDHTSRQLLSNAITVSQESRALTDLMSEFTAKDHLSYLSQAVLSDLTFSHREKLLAALRAEQRLLGSILKTPDQGPSGAIQPAEMRALVGVADRNLSLCEELTLGSNSSSRSAEAIIAELAGSVVQVRVRVLDADDLAQQAPQTTTSQTEKK